MSIASRRFLETFPRLISCRLKIDLGMEIIAPLAYSVLFSAIFGIFYGIFKSAVKLPKNTFLEHSAIIGVSVPILFISLFLLYYFWEASKVGVDKDEIKKLSSQTVHFMQVEGDQFCDRKKIAKIVKGKEGLSFIYITKSNLNSNEGDNIKDPNDAHCYLTSDKALTKLHFTRGYWYEIKEKY